MKRKLPRMMRPFPEEETHQSMPCARKSQATTRGSTRTEDVAAKVVKGITTRLVTWPGAVVLQAGRVAWLALKRMPTRFKVKLG